MIEVASALVGAHLSDHDALICMEGLATRFLPHSLAPESDKGDLIMCGGC